MRIAGSKPPLPLRLTTAPTLQRCAWEDNVRQRWPSEGSAPITPSCKAGSQGICTESEHPVLYFADSRVAKLRLSSAAAGNRRARHGSATPPFQHAPARSRSRAGFCNGRVANPLENTYRLQIAETTPANFLGANDRIGQVIPVPKPAAENKQRRSLINQANGGSIPSLRANSTLTTRNPNPGALRARAACGYAKPKFKSKPLATS